MKSQLQTCVGKEVFTTGKLAMGVARRMRRQDKGAVQAYRCSSCGEWHIGNAKHVRRR